ncbi:MAG: response regulator transcription factor [Chthoniobacteraceae bacterium]
MTPPLTALVIDDEIQIRRLLRVALEAAGYTVHDAASGQEGLQAVAFRRPDVVLLDLGLPDLDGREVLRRLREWSEVPVVILTVRDSEEEKVAVLDAGADDFVTKPFSTPELLARLRAAMRRAHPASESPVFTAGDLVVDMAARTVTKGAHELHLTATEYALLRLFIRHAGRVLTHRHILREIWGPKAEEQRQYLRVHIGNLRKKIEPSGRKEPLLRTEPGIGYRFAAAQC